MLKVNWSGFTPVVNEKMRIYKFLHQLGELLEQK